MIEQAACEQMHGHGNVEVLGLRNYYTELSLYEHVGGQSTVEALGHTLILHSAVPL